MRSLDDRNVLDKVCIEFCKVLEKRAKYIVVSGFVAISSGRTRGTEDIDVIIDRISSEEFTKLYSDLKNTGFECIQGKNPSELFELYLADKLSLRFVWKDLMLPEMELKMCKDVLDEYQIETRLKLPLTGLDIWFSSINVNLAFKEELLKSEKDFEDAHHLRTVYPELVDEKEINKVKQMIKQLRLKV